MAAWASGAWGALVWASGAWVGGTTTCAWEHGSWANGAWANNAWQCNTTVCAWEHGSWATGAWADGAWQCEGYTPPEVAPEVPTGGWAAYNDRDAERQRRKRLKALEDEDEADRLEALLISEGLLPPNPVINDRITVREYALQVDAFNRRTQRAVDYALKARTDLAYELAAREIANQLEDEEYAILLLLASL